MSKQPTSAPDAGVLLRGSLITLKRKCGKPTCACVDGERHATPALSYSIRGKTRILTLRPSDVPTIKHALTNYRRAVAALEKQALAGLRLMTLTISRAKRKA